VRLCHAPRVATITPASNLTAMPPAFPAGTHVTYTKTDANYPANDGWGMKLYLAGQSVIEPLAGAASAASFVFTLTDAITTPLLPGDYVWREVATKAGKSYEAASGNVEVFANIAAAGAGDILTWEQRMLPLIEAALTMLMTSPVQAYQIGNRSFTKADISRLLRIRTSLKISVLQQAHRGRFGIPIKALITGVASE